jgi:hypothetical protein
MENYTLTKEQMQAVLKMIGETSIEQREREFGLTHEQSEILSDLYCDIWIPS